MKTCRRATVVLVCLLACVLPLSAQTTDSSSDSQPSQPTSSSSASPTYGGDRLYLQFIRDAAIIPHQWWEGRVVFTDAESIDATVADFVVALQPINKVEVGGRIGFGTTSTSEGLPDGSGATDLQVWGKWAGVMGESQKTEFAFGGELGVPTGDDTAGLGTDSWNLAVFAAFRQPLSFAVLSWNAGFRFNDDGSIVGVPLTGEASGFLGGAILWPISDQFTFVGELDYESARFEGIDGDLRILGGVNWRPFNTGVLRGAVSAGLTDGAPNAQLFLGYAYTF
ncbi:MAG: hypothetical protein R3344_09285 [Acidobacteriota bacterium]|nr:hypothetical protein [Acidobacteriota bacterium]